MRDPRYLAVFRQQAREAAPHHTVTIVEKHLMLEYHPQTGRYTWYGREGVITRRQAVGWLESTTPWDKELGETLHT